MTSLAISHHFDWSEVQDSLFCLQKVGHRSKTIIVAFSLCQHSLLVCAVLLTSVSFKMTLIVRLMNSLPVCNDLKTHTSQ